jgi:NAD-dependent deacetylase
MGDLTEKAAELIQDSRNLMVLTGAGISHESGIPTFRGKDGLWDKYDPTELASIRSLQRDPLTVWQWYNWRRNLIGDAQPNPGHYAIAELEALKSPGYLLVTQNVDGLHRRAGSRDLVEVHGYIFRDNCMDCDSRRERLEPYPESELPPRCSECGGPLKPGVVMFGEMLPGDALSASIRFTEKADLILVVGTSAVVYPIASIPFEVKNMGGKIVEVNPDSTPVTPIADLSIQGPAGEVLPEIVSGLKAE